MTAEAASRIWLQLGPGLAIDVNAPERTAALTDPRRPPRELTGAIVVAESGDRGQAALERLTGGGLLAHPDLVWSLIDPLTPRLGPVDSARTVAERWWQRLAWWNQRDVAMREACARLLDQGEPGGGDLVRALDRLALAGSPFAGWQDVPGGHATPPPATRPWPPSHPLAIWFTDPEGLGAFYGGDFTPREGQGDLATHVAAALDDGVALVAEAGTGVGKTLAYLVPLIARLAAGEGRAVVSTHTRALQTQILEHDLPLLVDVAADLRPRLLMGRQNYLCLRQRLAHLSRPVTDLRDAVRAAALRTWLAATTDGMRDELTHHPLLGDLVPALFDSAQPCSPSQCFESHDCFVTRARRLARSSRLLVVNHALLVTDLAADRTVIGPYDHLVIDEAHRLPQVALETLAIRCDRQRRLDLLDLVGEGHGAEGTPEVPALLAGRLRHRPDGEAGALACEEFGRAAARALRALEVWWHALSEQTASALGSGDAGGRLRVRDREVAFAPLRPQTAELREAAALAVECGAVLAMKVEELGDLPAADTDLLVQLAQASQLFAQLEHDVRFLTEEREEAWVTWLEPTSRGVLRALGATPLDAGPLLGAYWDDTGLRPITTSATLAVGDDFQFMLHELGLAGRRPATRTVAVPSPFDFQRQALCLAVESMPAPDAPGYAAAVAEVLIALRRSTRRQTLVLFTSYRLLDAVVAQLRAADAGEVIVQSPGSGTGELLARFRGSEGALLLGVSTFWEGVDFPGRTLEILVVTKLPFLVPSDPWVEARCERLEAGGENAFTSFMVRDAVLRLRQGVGRLLRRDSDRGVIILLDNRLHTKSYGTTFLAALPLRPWFARGASDLADRVAEFWQQAGA